MHLAVHASLRKLRTTYIDLLYVHFWDFRTSIEEVMRSLHALVLAGKVLYLVCLSSPYNHTPSSLIYCPSGHIGYPGVGRF